MYKKQEECFFDEPAGWMAIQQSILYIRIYSWVAYAIVCGMYSCGDGETGHYNEMNFLRISFVK